MNKRIQTYKELLEEKERLQLLLKTQRETIRQDFHEIGEELKPVGSAVSFAGKIFTRDSSNLLLTSGINTAIDLVVRRLFLSKTGWLTKTIIPFFIKNYSSHINKDAIIKKLFSWIGKKNANGHEKVHEE